MFSFVNQPHGFFFLRGNQEFRIIAISPVMISMHIHAKFLQLFKINFYVEGTVVPRTTTVSLLTLKKLCFTFFNLWLIWIMPENCSQKGILKIFLHKKNLLLLFRCKQHYSKSPERNYQNSENHKESSTGYYRNLSEFRWINMPLFPQKISQTTIKWINSPKTFWISIKIYRMITV